MMKCWEIILFSILVVQGFEVKPFQETDGLKLENIDNFFDDFAENIGEFLNTQHSR